MKLEKLSVILDWMGSKFGVFLVIVVALNCLFLLISCSSDEENSSHPTKLIPRNTNIPLEFFLDNSDFIGEIEILSSSSSSREKPLKIESDVDARVREILKWSEKQKSLTVMNIPYISFENQFPKYIFLQNGRYLAFLKRDASGMYRPVTRNSLMPIYDGKCNPIWGEHSSNDPTVTKFVGQIKVDIESAIDKLKRNQVLSKPVEKSKLVPGGKLK